MSTKHESMMVVIGKSKYSEEKHTHTESLKQTNKRNGFIVGIRRHQDFVCIFTFFSFIRSPRQRHLAKLPKNPLKQSSFLLLLKSTTLASSSCFLPRNFHSLHFHLHVSLFNFLSIFFLLLWVMLTSAPRADTKKSKIYIKNNTFFIF
jgi:hypothetical protein